jgi:hypothetical protein
MRRWKFSEGCHLYSFALLHSTLSQIRRALRTA